MQTVCEEWKDVSIDPRYKVSSEGRVYSTRSGKVLKSSTDGKGYHYLSIDGKSVHVHRLVAENFTTDRNETVHHIDENKDNNSWANLEWKSNQENHALSSAKIYQMRSPEGKVVNIFNMRMFCRENGLDSSHMVKVWKGNLTQHKGWTK